tara:strand:+ start:73 stop:600 length:528 start_codon:yes stop_codon:yes gene_type:complete
MHNLFLKKYHFIDKFEADELNKLDKDISIIYRKYLIKTNTKLILKIKTFCKKRRVKFLLSNNIKLAIKLNLDGVYLPSFNNSLKTNIYHLKKKFIIIGSAHNIKEIRVKERQKVSEIFISSLFKNKKKFLGINRFKNISKLTKTPIIALGGINSKNINKLNLLNLKGFSGISYFK